MIVPVIAISNFVLTQQIYSEETIGVHAHYREPVPLRQWLYATSTNSLSLLTEKSKVPDFMSWLP